MVAPVDPERHAIVEQREVDLPEGGWAFALAEGGIGPEAVAGTHDAREAPGEVVGVYSHDRTRAGGYRGFSYPAYTDVRDRASSFSDHSPMKMRGR